MKGDYKKGKRKVAACVLRKVLWEDVPLSEVRECFEKEGK